MLVDDDVAQEDDVDVELLGVLRQLVLGEAQEVEDALFEVVEEAEVEVDPALVV